MLTEEQAGTIEEPDEHKLICALPGSGKTYTFISLAEEILKLKTSYSVLMVTFTNASASDMKVRIDKRLGKKESRRTKSSTFASLMMTQFKQISQGRRAIIGPEQYTFVKRAMIAEQLGTDEVNEMLSAIEELGRDPEYQSTGIPTHRVFDRYSKILVDHRRYDLNMMARELIQGIITGIVKPYTHSHILCDEFQDSDLLQYKWLKAHGDHGAKLACVGDDDQSIYSWRGSRGFKAFKDFQTDFGGSAYLLSKCFRCSPAILKSAKAFIENNEERLDKVMVSAIKEEGKVCKIAIPKEFISKFLLNKSKQDTISISGTATKKTGTKDQSQKEKRRIEYYRFVAEKINDSGKGGWACLARTNKQLDQLERALSELQMKAVRIGGKSIFDNLHAVGMISLFFGLVFDKATTELVSGLGWAGEKEDVLSQIDRDAKRMGFAAVAQMNDQQWSPITSYMQEISVLAKQCSTEEHAKKYVDKWHTVMKRVIKKIDDREKNFQLTVLDILHNILKGSKGDLKAHAMNIVDKTRKNNAKKDHKDESAVILSTMNGSKGLEWERVWIIDMEAGTVPMLKNGVTVEAIEEERRLVYVAMTRAERELYLSYKEEGESMFIAEIDGVMGGI